jgi:hypothetical protein
MASLGVEERVVEVVELTRCVVEFGCVLEGGGNEKEVGWKVVGGVWESDGKVVI